MLKVVRGYLKGILYEPEGPSLTRAISFFGVLLFAVVTIYLVLKNQTWAHYETFSTIAGGGGIAGQVGNKFINSRFGRDAAETLPGPGGTRNV